MTVGLNRAAVETALGCGGLRCPTAGCGGLLGPWGWARERAVRGVGRLLPRRSRCLDCRRTQVLLPASVLLRRADAVTVVGAALLAKATGSGHRPIAAALGRPACTVRGWLRRFGALAEVVRVFFTRLLHSFDPMAGPLLPRDCVFADAVEALGRAGAAGVRRLSPRPPWEFASWASGGLLLAPGGGQVSNTS